MQRSPHEAPSGKEDLLRDACKPVMAAYKNGCRTYPESYVSNMQWSLEFLKRVLVGERIPSSIRITGAALFGGSPLDLAQKPEFQTPSDPQRAVQAFTTVPGQSSSSADGMLGGPIGVGTVLDARPAAGQSDGAIVCPTHGPSSPTARQTKRVKVESRGFDADTAWQSQLFFSPSCRAFI